MGKVTPIADILPLLSRDIGLLTLPGVLLRVHLPLENEIVLIGGDSVVIVELKDHVLIGLRARKCRPTIVPLETLWVSLESTR